VRRPRPATLAIGLTVVLWAGAFTAIKALLDDGLAGEEIAAARYLVAAPGFVLLLWRSGGLGSLDRRDTWRIAVAGLLSVTVYHVALNVGERSTTSGVASLLVALAPALTLCFAVASGQERFSRTRLAGIALAFGGVAVVVVLGSGAGEGSTSALGPLIVLIASVSFAAYNVVLKPLLGRADLIAVTSAASLVGTVALLPFGALELPHELVHLGLRDTALVLYLGLGATIVGYIGWNVGLRAVEASRAVTFLYVVPPLALTFGALFLGEPVTVWIVAGGALIVGGVALAQRGA
jgi:drug/metabolite transporter (DMT)-like permease